MWKALVKKKMLICGACMYKYPAYIRDNMGMIASKQRLERSLRSLLMTRCSRIALSGFPQGHLSFCCLSQLKILHLFQPGAYMNRYTHRLYMHHHFYQLKVSVWIYQHVSNFLLFKLVKYLCVFFSQLVISYIFYIGASYWTFMVASTSLSPPTDSL